MANSGPNTDQDITDIYGPRSSMHYFNIQKGVQAASAQLTAEKGLLKTKDLTKVPASFERDPLAHDAVVVERSNTHTASATTSQRQRTKPITTKDLTVVPPPYKKK